MDDKEFLAEINGYRRKMLSMAGYWGVEYDAYDTVQRTILLAWMNRHTFRGDSTLKTWLFAILKNQCATTRKRHAHRAENEDGTEDLVDTPLEPSYDPYQDTNIAIDVRTAVDSLPPYVSRVISLIYYDGLTLAEVAKELKTSMSRTYRIASRGHELLQQRLVTYSRMSPWKTP